MATIPSQRTWAAADVVTAAMMNSNVRDAVNFWLTARPKAHLLQGVAQSFTTATAAALTFDTEVHDNDGGHSTSTNTSRYTAVTPGWYMASGGVGWASNAVGIRLLRWSVNGTTVNGSGTQVYAPATSVVIHLPARTIMVFLTAGDFLELNARQDSGGALLTTVGSENAATMTVMWVGS